MSHIISWSYLLQQYNETVGAFSFLMTFLFVHTIYPRLLGDLEPGDHLPRALLHRHLPGDLLLDDIAAHGAHRIPAQPGVEI